MEKITWNNIQTHHPKSYKCGYCGQSVSSEKGYSGSIQKFNPQNHTHYSVYIHILICHHCTRPTFFDINDMQIPGPILGNPVKHIPEIELEKLFNEAKSCYSISAYTASVMCCRKLLMNIAVAQGEKAGKSFVEYVNSLDSQGYLPPNGRQWVDSIRKAGNEATHDITPKTEEQARILITFTEMLLRFIYEMPGLL